MAIQSIAVFCGSKNGNNTVFKNHAVELGVLLAKQHTTLIYGGGNVGIMGVMADTVMKQGGKVIGVIPQLLLEWERQHEGITELIVTEDMHTRKKNIFSLCDAAIILPGGFGTLDELFEMLTWNQLSIHNKPIFIINSAGFYTDLIHHMRNLAKDGFLYDELEKRITILDDPSQFVQYLL